MARLDGVELKYDPGSGHMDLAAFVDPSKYGISLTLEGRIKRAISLYAQGSYWRDLSERVNNYSAHGGVRLTWGPK